MYASYDSLCSIYYLHVSLPHLLKPHSLYCLYAYIICHLFHTTYSLVPNRLPHAPICITYYCVWGDQKRNHFKKLPRTRLCPHGTRKIGSTLNLRLRYCKQKKRKENCTLNFTFIVYDKFTDLFHVHVESNDIISLGDHLFKTFSLQLAES